MSLSVCFNKIIQIKREIPIEIIAAHREFMRIIHTNLPDFCDAKHTVYTPIQMNYVYKFVNFISDITNIGLGNENGQHGYFNAIDEDESSHFDIDCFEYPLDDTANDIGMPQHIMEFLGYCGFEMNDELIAAYGGSGKLPKHQYIWTENTILVKI